VVAEVGVVPAVVAVAGVVVVGVVDAVVFAEL
jgi:hypothetical protein